ncbi:phospholipase [Nocardiopsis gilva YIM 90087]|uniref:Phospholipase n=1 Tax=Nocardiopsis gilva YIM 90087 TaxID=1235441 RepID=A0A223SDS7_9ACTN|nr:phospholipase [Nocardiopsis gilva YIM 90087]
MSPGSALLSPRGRVNDARVNERAESSIATGRRPEGIGGGASGEPERAGGSEFGANRWFRRLREGVFDVDDVIARAHELADFVAAAADFHGLDTQRLVAAGFSNGANIAAAMLLLRPGLLRGAALFAAAAPLQERTPEPVDLAGTSVFVSAGHADTITPLDQAQLLAGQLTERGAAVRFHEHPGSHSLPTSALHGAREWLDGR